MTIVVLCSLLLNLLTFAGSVYMMLVYDSVLPSRSIPTLFGLFVILVSIYLFQALFEAIRNEAMLGFANGVRDDLSRTVHYATIDANLRGRNHDGDGMQPVRDLDQVHSFLSSQGPVALIDLPWVIVFLMVLTALHWLLGLTALLGALVLAGITWTSARKTQTGTRDLTRVAGRRSAALLTHLRFAESARAMGMHERLLSRSAHWEDEHVAAQSLLARTVARFGGAGRSFRILLQSMILTAGALLVIDGKASGGIILASSVLAGRALAPVDQAIANWRGLSAARAGWARLMDLIQAHRPPNRRAVTLAPPTGAIELRDVWVAPPGTQKVVLGGVSLSMAPGQAIAVIGPSAAGKTSLAKVLLGIWPAARGEVRIDGATHDQWDLERLGSSFGYVPQAMELFDGTISENISRLDPRATSEGIIAAAKAAGLHELILGMPNGYDTHLSASAVELSAGQRQRIGLARALYGDPFLVVLDEANSNLDAEGDAALAAAVESVKARGGIVVMITHRPAALGPVTHIAVLRSGRLADFGERDTVLARLQQATELGLSENQTKPKVVPAR